MEVGTIGRKRVYDMFAVFVISVAPLDCNVRPTWLLSQPYHLPWGYLAVEVTWIISAGCKVQVQRFTHTLLVSALLRQRFALITYLPACLGQQRACPKVRTLSLQCFRPSTCAWILNYFDNMINLNTLHFYFCFCFVNLIGPQKDFSLAKKENSYIKIKLDMINTC